MSKFPASLKCIEPECSESYPVDSDILVCPRCTGLLDVAYDLSGANAVALRSSWDERRGSPSSIDASGVWRFRELLPPARESEVVTMIEGNSQLFDAPRSAEYAGLESIVLKHLGMNPTGSFKDLGMTTGITEARKRGADGVICASTGNTSASMAAYAARAGIRSFVFIPEGKIARGKLAQAIEFGARVIQIDGDFDRAMSLVREIAGDAGLYLLNSVNPFRLEGQKTVAFEILQQRQWSCPDRIVIPGGNLGNSSAIAKGFKELIDCGLISRMPRLSIVQAEGANPLYRMWSSGKAELIPVNEPATLATAIRIGAPVSWKKARRALDWMDGNVEQVSEQEIADAKAVIGLDGIGCEPAGAVTVAGLRKMVAAGTVDRGEDVIAIVTGHSLKDPDYTVSYHEGSLGLESPFANRVVKVSSEHDAIMAALK
jgi:threonine synthase